MMEFLMILIVAFIADCVFAICYEMYWWLQNRRVS